MAENEKEKQTVWEAQFAEREKARQLELQRNGQNEATEMRIEAITNQRDVAIRHIAEWCIAIEVNGAGWDDWDEYFKDAATREHKLPEIRDLLSAAIDVARVAKENQ